MTFSREKHNATNRASYERQRQYLRPGVCSECGEQLRKPSPDALCGFCREEKALSA